MEATNTNNVYTLTKNVLKNGKFKYVVTDQNGNVISDRTSARDYVACTACMRMCFGRLDLIGKGDHGKYIKRSIEDMQTTEEQWANWGKNYRCTREEFIEGAKKCYQSLNSIAYLNA